ncbi:MAG: hypothetical protein OEW87_13760, partial [Flavobacteriaceae bacterium]|nr:hypothetical protein [Flavobacteriaceae bacterium]
MMNFLQYPHPPQALACTLSKKGKAPLCHCKHYLSLTAPPPPIFEFEENARGRGPAPVLSARASDQRRYIAPSPFRAGGGYTPKDPQTNLGKWYQKGNETKDLGKWREEIAGNLPVKEALALGNYFNVLGENNGATSLKQYYTTNELQSIEESLQEVPEVIEVFFGENDLTIDYEDNGSVGSLLSVLVEYKKDKEGIDLKEIGDVEIGSFADCSIEERQIFSRAAKFIKELLNEAVKEGLKDEKNIEEYLLSQKGKIQDEIIRIKNEIKSGGEGKEDFIGIPATESEKLTGSMNKFNNFFGFSTKVSIMDKMYFDEVKGEYESGNRQTDKDVVVIIGKNEDGTYDKYFKIKDGLFVLPTEKTLDDGTTITLNGTEAEVVEIVQRFIITATEYERVKIYDEKGNEIPIYDKISRLEVTDANGQPSTIDPDVEPVLNIFEKGMWVVKVAKDVLDEVGIDEKRWNENDPTLNNDWPFFVYDLLAGLGNATLDELKSIPEMVSLGLSMFDKEARQQLWESVTNLSFETLEHLYNNKVELYQKSPEYAGSYDAATVIIAILTGGKKVFDELTSVLRKSGK